MPSANDCMTSKPRKKIKCPKAFALRFIRKRRKFSYLMFSGHSFDSHTGRILVTKPGFEHR
jgi:hypothetical protein